MNKKNKKEKVEVRGTKNMTDQELLQFAYENGIINIADVQEQYEMKKRQELLAMHPYTISQGKDGFWYTYLPDETKGRIKRKRKTRNEIEKVVIDYWRQQEENPTIKEVFTEWNDRRLSLGKIQMSTYQRNEQIFKRHYASFGRRKIGAVSMIEFEEFLEEQIPEHNLTAKAFSNLKTITRGFLKRAKRRNLISYNIEEIFTDIDTTETDFKKVIKEDNQEVFDEQETPKVMDYLNDNPDILNLGLLLTFVTGVRVGELCTLKWEDVEEQSIKIRRTETRYYVNKKAVYEVKEFPKTAAGVRSVAIPNDYKWILKRIRSMNPFGEFVFMRNGERLKAFSFRNRLRLVCEKTDSVQKSPHKIRKTYGTILMDNHVDNRLAMGQMGHTDISCTENHYHRNRRDIDTKVSILSSIPEFQRK